MFNLTCFCSIRLVCVQFDFLYCVQFDLFVCNSTLFIVLNSCSCAIRLSCVILLVCVQFDLFVFNSTCLCSISTCFRAIRLLCVQFDLLYSDEMLVLSHSSLQMPAFSSHSPLCILLCTNANVLCRYNHGTYVPQINPFCSESVVCYRPKQRGVCAFALTLTFAYHEKM